MASSSKSTEQEKTLASAHADLTAIQKKRAVLAAREDAAALSADRYAQWCTECEAADTEIARLTKLVATREAVVRETAQAAADAEKRREVEACRAVQKAIAARYRDEAARLTVALMSLARDDARATIEANRLNANLPPGVEPIAIGGFVARETPRQPRKNIATKEVSLWVNAANGGLVGNQDQVVDNRDGTGHIAINRSQRIECVRRRYTSTTYHPGGVFDHPGYFFQQLRLPFPDRPGLAFDGACVTLEGVANMPVDLPPPPKIWASIVQTELVPIDPWNDTAKTMAGRNIPA